MKIVSWNIANYDDHPKWLARKKLIANEIINADADVIALQEVRFNREHPSTKATGLNAAEQILALLHSKKKYVEANIVTQPAMQYEPHGFWEGLSIISKFDIMETGTMFHTLIHNPVDLNKRITQYAVIVADELIFFIFNTHFSYNELNLRSNIGELMNYTERFQGYPLLLLGDMNTVPQNENIHKLTMEGFKDIWVQRNHGKNGFTYPSKDPVKRIDYGWANKLLIDNIKDIELIGKKADKEGILPSDHLGLVITL